MAVISHILTQLSCGSSTNVWGVDAAHNVYQYQYNGSSWTQTQVPGQLKQVSVAADGSVWGVAPDGTVYQHNGNTAWTKMPGNLVQVSVGSASLIWGVNQYSQIYKYTGTSWMQIPGALKQVSVASDGSVWGVDANGTVYRYRGDQTGTWVQLPGHGPGGTFGSGPGTFTQVAVASASLVYALDPSDCGLYRYTGDDTNSWSMSFTTNTMTYYSMASDITAGVIDQGVTTITIYTPG